jgi:DNA polymerase-4
MPMHQARRLVGAAAVVLPPRGVVYGVASGRVLDTVRALVPILEQLSFDEAFGEPVELAGAPAAEVERFCEHLRARVRAETGLVASVGAGSGKQIAKIASGLAKPDGIRVVRRAEEPLLLGELSVRRLWGIGPVAEEKLHRLGIDTVVRSPRSATPRSPTSSAAPSGPRCTGWRRASTTAPSRSAQAPSRSAPNRRSLRI